MIVMDKFHVIKEVNNAQEFQKALTPFLVVKETVRNWYNEIFNYFEYPYTNAITESINVLFVL